MYDITKTICLFFYCRELAIAIPPNYIIKLLPDLALHIW